MVDVRQLRIERYETWAVECEMLARVAMDDPSKKQYEHLAAHYYYLATSFRKALALHSAALVKLTLQ
jgi:hypothetical protein